MRGRKVERRFGWDCHGLPVEIPDREGARHSTARRDRRVRHRQVQRGLPVHRPALHAGNGARSSPALGRWVDFDHDYKTMDPDYMESIWWVLERALEQGPALRGLLHPPYCPRCSTSLSNHELNLGGYNDVSDPAITREVRRGGESLRTLLPRLDHHALDPAVEPRALPSARTSRTSRSRTARSSYILAEARLPAYYKDPAEYQIVARNTGAELAGQSYEPLFPYFADLKEKGAFRTWIGDFVTTEDGTGIVHIAPASARTTTTSSRAPAFPSSARWTRRRSSPPRCPTTQGSSSRTRTRRSSGRLKERGQARQARLDTPPYPHCWRCKSPLIYRAISEWFVSVEKIKTRHARRQRRRSTGCPPTSRPGGSASGWRTPGTGRSRATATGATPSPSGAATRCKANGLHRLPGGARARTGQEGRPTCTSTSSTRSPIPCSVRRHHAPHTRGARLLVRVRRHALRPEPLPLREQGALRGALPRGLHLRVHRPDPRLVLHPRCSGRRPFRQADVPQRAS